MLRTDSHKGTLAGAFRFLYAKNGWSVCASELHEMGTIFVVQVCDRANAKRSGVVGARNLWPPNGLIR